MKIHRTLINAFRIFVIFCLLLPAAALPTSNAGIVQARALVEESTPAPAETQIPEETKEPIPPEETPVPTEIPLPESTETPTPLPADQPSEEPAGDDDVHAASLPDIPDEEYEALIALYASTNGDEWTDHTGWNSPDSACTWYGITCEGDLITNNVVAIDLPNNQLSGTIPDLKSLVQLKVLNLAGNQLTGSVPSELGDMNTIEILNLGSNQFTGTIPSSFANLAGLRELHLNLNQLAGPLPDTLANLQALEKLYLNGNKSFKGNLPGWIVGLPALKELNIANNLFDGPLPGNIGNLGQTLILFDISQNHFWGEIPASITKLTKLNSSDGYTDIRYNHLTSKNTAVRSFLAKKNSDWEKTQTPLNLVPVIRGLNPPSTTAGSGELHLEVRGKNMMAGTVVYWNDKELPVTFKNSWTLEVVVPEAYLVDEATAILTAVNPYPTLGPSAAFPFHISNLIPAHGSTVLSRRPGFAWPEIPHADRYQLQLSTSSTFSTLLLTAASPVPELTLTTNLPLNRTVYWRVRGRVDGVYGDWSPGYQFRSANPPSTPVLLSPANNSVTRTYKPKLSWDSISLPAGTAFEKYELQISTDAAFTQPVLTHFIEKQATRSYVINKDPANPEQILLKPNTKYFWRVRAYNSLAQVSNWSSTRSIRAVMLPPLLIDPPNGGNSQSLRPTFIWSPVYEEHTLAPTSYRIQLSLSSSFRTILISASPKQPEWTPTKSLPKNKTVYWRVRATNANGTTTWAKGAFLSANPPSTPILVSPSAGELLTNYDPALQLTWSVSSLPAGTTFKHYVLQLSRQNNFPQTADTIEYLITERSTPLQQIEELSPNTRYYWRVLAMNTLNHRSLWTPVRSFKTAMLPVQDLQVHEQITTRPNFSWAAPVIFGDGPAPTSYTIQFSLSENFSSLITSGIPNSTAFIPSVDLPRNRTIYWRVRANGEFGPTSWTSSSFLSANPPSIPSLQSPDNDYLSQDYQPKLVWSQSTVLEGATFKHYLVHISTDKFFAGDVITREVTSNSYTFASGELAANHRYYWRVRAENTAGHYSTWSAVRNFRTALKKPTLLSPIGGVKVTTRYPEFRWEMDSYTGVSSYNIQLSQDVNFGTLITSATTTSTSYTSTVALPISKNIYWRVRANGPNGPSLWSTGQFASANPPSTPRLKSPANGSILKTNPSKLDWFNSTVPKGVTFLHYEVEIAKNASFTSPQKFLAGIGNPKQSELAWPALSARTKYYWRVRAVGSGGQISPWSVEWSFTTP
jgi:Leucine-rich repeat (LRR) protein